MTAKRAAELERVRGELIQLTRTVEAMAAREREVPAVPEPNWWGGRPEAYEEACARATTAQGLDPLVEGLRAAGVAVEVDQTGGFCMVVRVNEVGGRGWFGIINEGTAEEPRYNIGRYGEPESPDSERDEELIAVNVATVAEVMGVTVQCEAVQCEAIAFEERGGGAAALFALCEMHAQAYDEAERAENDLASVKRCRDCGEREMLEFYPDGDEREGRCGVCRMSPAVELYRAAVEAMNEAWLDVARSHNVDAVELFGQMPIASSLDELGIEISEWWGKVIAR